MSQPLTPRHKGILLAALTAVISGFAVFINGLAVRAWSGIADGTVFTTLKNLMAALIIGLIAALMAARRSDQRPMLPSGRGPRLTLVAIALVGGSVPFVLFFEGLAHATSVQAGFIHKTLIIWVAVLAFPFLKERLAWPHLVALALLVWGQLMLAGTFDGVLVGSGELMILMATLLWSVEVVIAKRVLASVNWATVAGARMLGGSLVLVAWVLIRGLDVSWSALTPFHWTWILVTGIILSGYVLTWFGALSLAPAIDVTAVIVGGALITAILQTVVGNLPLPNPIGLASLAVGVALVGLASIGAYEGVRE